MGIELGPHQLKAIGEIKNGSVLRGGVGTGKSRTALAYFFLEVCGAVVPINGRGSFGDVKAPRDLYIITTAKKRDDLDWLDEAHSFGISSDPELSAGGIRITIDSWNNIAQYVDVRDAYFIFDEQRLVGSGAWVKAFQKIVKQNLWILLTATPGDVWMDFVAVFVAHGFYKNQTEFLRRHAVYNTFTKFPKVDHYVEIKELEKLRDAIIVEMPYNRHTRRHLETRLVSYDEGLFNRALKDRWHVYENRPLRDVGELFIVMRKIVNSDLSRIGEVMKLLEKHPRLIVFYNFNYELDALRTLAGTLGITLKEWNGHKHEAVPDDERWIYLVQYTAGSEGWNCITTDAECFYSLTYSYKVFEQAQGRVDRLNTPFVDLWYYILRSGSLIDQAISKSLANKQAFNEKKSKFGKSFEMAPLPKGVEPILNYPAQMCIKQTTHDRHNWTDGIDWYQCFGGPFTDYQKEITISRQPSYLRPTYNNPDVEF